MKNIFVMIKNIIGYILIYVLMQFIISIISRIYYAIKYYNTGKTIDQLNQLYNQSIFLPLLISALVSFLIYILILKNKEENFWKRCKFKTMDFNSCLLIVLTSTGFVAVTAFFVNLVQQTAQSYENVSNTMVSGLSTITGVLAIVVFIPIFEEILFRGLVFNELKKTLNIVLSILIQALIFGAFHGNLIQGIYTFTLAIILSLLYLWLDSLWAPIICHITFNFMGTIIFPILMYVSGKYSFVYSFFGLLALIYGLIALYTMKNSASAKL